MTAYGIYAVVLTVVVMIGVAVFILLFERKRARQIEHDLHGMATRRSVVGKGRDDTTHRVTRKHDRGTER